ncbi:N-acetylmuramoyl-L-alanine amidase [Actinomyces provencensis]|uniref:N-acetylmuramoyl-L-alanine amidase n=1 Tax=Actinomyces provencensis TaxID=1720198 RepID=UPI002280B863|nr:N-acetylmuramoyl-L-alanine amidase [Actinomyces provencensis]
MSTVTPQSGAAVTPQSGGVPASGTGGEAGSSLGTTPLSSVFPSSTTGNGLPVSVSSRSDWGANESLRNWDPELASASFVVVHHTAGTNNYSMDQSASVVRGIYYYHAVTNGWGDIGYNFLVDKWGRAFEGRSGSLSAPAAQMVIGAHDRGFNTGTMGISMMGDYSSVTPSSATIDTVGKLAGWFLGRAGVSPDGTGRFTPTLSNGTLVAGRTVTVNRISGHRDTFPTSCPGNSGYAQLPTIRGIATATAAPAGANPVGRIEASTPDTGEQAIYVSGWAYDTDVTSPIKVRITLDGTPTTITTDLARPDVKAAFNLSHDKAGFSTKLTTTPGTHTICATALNQKGGTDTSMGCTTTTLKTNTTTKANPVGRIEASTPDTGEQAIYVSGWAYDTDVTSPIKVRITLDGTPTTITTDLARPDVKAAFNLSHDKAGFSTKLTTTPGTHTICATALNQKGGTDTSMGCTTTTLKTNTTTPASFDPGNIISDEVMFDSSSMTQAEVQAFLDMKNPHCASAPSGIRCLKDFTVSTTRMTAKYCSPYEAASQESGASVIWRSATLCDVNPQTLLVMLQKEQGLVTATGSSLTSKRYAQAMGFQLANASYASFPAQVYQAAARLRQYGEEPASFRYRAGQTTNIPYFTTASCGSSEVTIQNRATAALYNYTPYQPNAAALANMYGEGDTCSTYGNRNFWRYFKDWFPSAG